VPPSKPVAHQRARVGALSRSVRAGERPQEDLDAAKQELVAVNLEDSVRKVLSSAPRPTDERLTRIAALLAAGGDVP
jgi:hypothetical protein